jgi:tetrahydromethanopterin S-methyltransferase subunit B
MIQPSTNGRSGLRPRHGVLVVGSVLLTAIVAYAAFGFIVGTIAFLVKLAVVVGVAYLVVKLVFRRTKSS